MRSTRHIGDIVVHRLGLHQRPLVDLYHLLITARWRFFFLSFIGFFVAFNSTFAGLYLLGGDCIAHARPGFFWDYFFFSVQTLVTIGYGVMAPKTFYANLMVSFEAMSGLVIFALTTGITFARFSRPSARIIFSRNALVTNMMGKPTLLFRMANVRTNQIVDAAIRLYLVKDEITPEGVPLRRFYSLRVVRDISPMFILSWTVMHPIDAESPMMGLSQTDLQNVKAQILITVSGLDGDFSQNLYARHFYYPDDIVYGGMFEDAIDRAEDGSFTIDFDKFHTLKALSQNVAAKSQ